MEVVTSLSTNINGANGGTKKHIQEWSRLDKLTGMREHARVEADHWASNTSNSRHHFGKVVDSRARNLADGSVQQKQQTKQLEVFQAHIPGGSVQVIRSHTSTTSSWHNSKVLQSQSSTWTSSNPTDNLLKRRIGDMEVEIDSLKFDHNPVNLDSEKAKVNIARHLTNRRPPTRSKFSKISDNDTVSTYLPITYDFNEENKSKTNDDNHNNTDETKMSAFSSSTNTVSQTLAEFGREKLDKKKSISDENLPLKLHLDDGNVEEKVISSPWMRSCKTRRSFQHPTSSRYKDKIETAVENKSELENVLKKVLRNKPDFELYSKNLSTAEIQKPKQLHKKSFVTEATLQETKRKLRHLSKDKIGGRRNSFEEADDGISTGSKRNSDNEDEKAATHEELENSLIKNPSPKCVEFRTINKSDDWFDRRKSYGFEPVRQPNTSSSLNSTPKTNSSTDSGICRSSELELASTSIVKKVTEGKEDKIHSTNMEDTKSHEISGNSEVPELMRKFEKLDKSKIGATVITFTEVPKINVLDSQRNVIKKGRVSEAIKSFERNGINCKTSEPTSLTKIGSYFLEELDQKENQLTTEQDFLAKRHSIACDDTKYMTSTFKFPESAFPEKISFPGKTTLVNVNNFESSNSPSPFTDADAKKPKKVEFSKTEVHFAATEPGKIRIVETDEKPPPTNLYRKKKRSVSVSPRSDLPKAKFGVFDNFTDPENTADEKSNDGGFRSQFTSTVSDNGLAVTISSTKPTDYRRASWSVVEDLNSSPVPFENKPAYSTKINFCREGITVVADSKSPQHEKTARESRISSTKTTNKTKYANGSQNGENIHERLIVSIGGSSCDNRTTGKYVQKPTFTNSFRNSIKSSKAAIALEKLASKKNDSLKSTSLIINTIKQSANKKSVEKINNKIVEKENEITYTKNENFVSTAEQPSTYITEMNKLQRKYRVKENQSVIDGVIKNEKNISFFYNTIPAVKNGYARSKLLNNDLPAVLSAFDNLCRTIDEVMERKTNSKNQNTRNSVGVVENVSISAKTIHDERSSQPRFLYDTVTHDDGNISDDSLKADKEVQSYMSTAIMEEYENELCGSWSRKRYFKHIKPIKIVPQDEISEKCHFKPLKNNEDELKIIANMVDVKKPKIASVVMKSDGNEQRDGNSTGSLKKSTVILNKSPKIETTIDDKPTKEIDDHVKPTHNLHQATNTNSISSKTNDYVNVADLKEMKQSNISTKPNVQDIFKKETEPTKIIYHNIELSDKVVKNEYDKKSYLSRRGSAREVAKKHDRKVDSRESIVHHGSIRRPTKSTSGKEKLPDSGRDGWLNLPKESKISLEKKTIESNGKHEIYRKPHIDHVKKDKRSKSGINGYGDISSEEDSTKKSRKLYVPLSTIPEKSKVDRTSKLPVTKKVSNSSTETQSNPVEFKNPVLKTEERSRRRAARMLHRASSREVLMNSNVASSSDDVTSENEIHYSRSSKPRNIRKLKYSPKTVKPITATSNLPPKKTVTSSAKMQINIFNIKDRTNSERRSSHTHNLSSRSSNCIDDNKLSKFKPRGGERETHPNIPEKSRPKQVSCNIRDARNMSTSTTKSTRPIR